MDEFYGTLGWFQNPSSQVSAHIVIAPDGTIAQVVDPDLIAWHAPAYNSTYLGIEFAKRNPHFYHDQVTPQMYRAAGWWLREMAARYGQQVISRDRLREHRQVQSDKIDIGPGFSLDLLMEAIRG